MKKINVEILNWKVIYTNDEKDFKKICRMINDVQSTENIYDMNYDGICISDSENSISFIVVLDNTISTLTHEMLHAVQNMCRARSIKDDETEAHILTYLMKQVLEENKIIRE